jgi:hypothetical protein
MLSKRKRSASVMFEFQRNPDATDKLHRFVDKLVNGLWIVIALSGALLSLFSFFFKWDFINGFIKNSPYLVLFFICMLGLALWKERNEVRKERNEVKAAFDNISAGSPILKAMMGVKEQTSRNEVVEFAVNCAKFEQLRSKMKGRQSWEIILDLWNEERKRVEWYAKGQINLPKHESPWANERIMETFCERMDAVSQDDLNWWIDDPQGDVYLRKSVEVRRKSKGGSKAKVTRIFIFTDADLDKRNGDVYKVLEWHYNNGIEFGLAMQGTVDDLERSYTGTTARFDFALFNQKEAATFFRKEDKRFIAIFPMGGDEDENDKRIAEQRELWIDLICECWVVSKQFANSVKNVLKKEEWEKVKTKTKDFNEALKQVVDDFQPEDDEKVFPLCINKELGDIKEKVDRAFAWYKLKYHAYESLAASRLAVQDQPEGVQGKRTTRENGPV